MNWQTTILVLLPLLCSSSSAQNGGGGSPTVAFPAAAKHETSKDSALEAITLKQLQNLSPDQAREVFKALSPESKCRLWKRRLARVLASNQLDERQIGMIATVECVIAPELYSGTRKASTDNLLQDLEADARVVFSPEQFDSIFMFLGARSDTTQTSAFRGFSKIRARRIVDCYCSTGSDYCGGTSTCRRGRCVVDPSETGTGCGFLWLWICNGRCWR